MKKIDRKRQGNESGGGVDEVCTIENIQVSLIFHCYSQMTNTSISFHFISLQFVFDLISFVEVKISDYFSFFEAKKFTINP